MNLIPVLKNNAISYYIVKKSNDNRNSSNIVSEYKKNLKKSEQNLKNRNKENKLFNQF